MSFENAGGGRAITYLPAKLLKGMCKDIKGRLQHKDVATVNSLSDPFYLSQPIF